MLPNSEVQFSRVLAALQPTRQLILSNAPRPEHGARPIGERKADAYAKFSSAPECVLTAHALSYGFSLLFIFHLLAKAVPLAPSAIATSDFDKSTATTSGAASLDATLLTILFFACGERKEAQVGSGWPWHLSDNRIALR